MNPFSSVPSSCRTIVSASLIAGLLIAIRSAQAATSTWSGSSDAIWSSSGNWDALPAATGDTLVFSGSSNLSNTNDFVTGISGLSFSSGAGAFILGGNAITIASGSSITNSSSSLQTINFNITNGGTTTVDAASGNITFGGAVASNSLNITGANTVTLGGTASNTNLGATIGSGSTLVLAKNGNNAIVGTVNVSAGGTLKLNGATGDQIHFNQVVNMNGAGAVFDMNGKTEEIGKLQGTGGTVTNTAASTTSTLTVGGGTNSSDFSNVLLANGAGTLAVTTRAVSASTYTLGSANTFTGKMTIGGTTNVSMLANGGVASSIGAGSNSSANLAISASSILRYTGGSASTDRGFTTGSSTTSLIEVVNAATNLEFTSASIGGFTKTGAGTLTLSGNVASASAPSVTQGTLVLNAPGANAYSGAIAIASGGTMKIGSASSGNMLHDNTTVAVNGTFDLGGNSEKVNSISGSGSVINSGGAQSVLTVSGFGGSTVFGGVISGNIALTHSDASSSTTLNGLNTYSGNTTIGSSTASLVLGSTGGLTFYIGANDVSNKVTGVSGATATFNGGFTFDLGSASLVDGNSWTLVDSGLNKSFAGTFTVAGFSESGNVWTLNSGQNTWSFSEATGVLSLSVAAIPEPSAYAGLGGLLTLGFVALRRRRSV